MPALKILLVHGGGFVLGGLLGDAGVLYFANLLKWMQNASLLVFVGGVSEAAKRLTLWLALLGASIATSQGKHINVDVVGSQAGGSPTRDGGAMNGFSGATKTSYLSGGRLVGMSAPGFAAAGWSLPTVAAGVTS